MTVADHSLAYLDADVLLGHYPFRQFPYSNQDVTQLKSYLQARGIVRACVSSLHALFYTDPQQGNDEHLPQVMDDKFFIPVAVINPSLPNWRRGLAKSRQAYGVQMVRLAPSYHTYSLREPFALECIQEIVSQGLRVSIVKRIEDERMRHPLMKPEEVENGAILDAAATVNAPLLVHGLYLSELAELSVAPNLLFDIAFMETMDTLAKVTALVPPARLLYSSHAPFFYPEANTSKVRLWQTSDANRAQIANQTLSVLLGNSSYATATVGA